MDTYDIEAEGREKLAKILAKIKKAMMNAHRRATTKYMASIFSPRPPSPCPPTNNKRRRRKHCRTAKKAELKIPSLMDIDVPEIDGRPWISRTFSTRQFHPQPGNLRPVGVTAPGKWRPEGVCDSPVPGKWRQEDNPPHPAYRERVPCYPNLAAGRPYPKN